MAAEALRVIDPLEYFGAHLRRGVRPDGRALLSGRRLTMHNASLTSADGSAMLRMGKTTVLAGVQCDLTAPAEAEPSRGRVVIGLELPAICSPAAAAALSGGGGRLDRDKAVLVELLQRTASGGLLDLDELCAVEGVAVWSCYCDIYVLEHDGNLTDAAMLAMMAALSSLRLPRVALEEASGALTVIEEAAVQVRLAKPLFPCTFGLLGDELVLDPCAEEESLLSSSFTILVDAKGERRAILKPGGAPLPEGTLRTCTDAARRRLPQLLSAVEPLASVHAVT